MHRRSEADERCSSDIDRTPLAICTMDDTVRAEGSRRIAEQACHECRRRKSKCNRAIPSCLLCSKFARVCIYEKRVKTPLTRQYLSEVEEELAQTKALLQQVLSEGAQQDRQHKPPQVHGSEQSHDAPATMDGLRGGDAGPVSPSVQGRRTASVHGNGASTGGHTPIGNNSNTQMSCLDGPGDDGHSPNRPAVSTRRTSHRRQRESGLHSITASDLSLETPPSSGSFEWDERTGKANGDRFVDGMASLTSRSNEGGYLGVASGAALLRMADSRSAEEVDTYGPDQQPELTEFNRPPVFFALTSLSQLEPFIDAYFQLYHCSYPIVHEATFRAQFMEVIPRPNSHAWQVLLYSMAALGAFTTSTQPTDTDIGLFEAAKARLSIDVLETGNLLLVQALTLISNYLQKRNKPNSGYNYMGLARRIAMGIGLHKEFPTWEASLLAIEMRRRCWYCLYIFDVGAIITFSRPLDFPDDGIDVELPMNVHDSDITASSKQRPDPAQETTIYTHLRAQATFHLATSRIYSRIISSPFPSVTSLIEMDESLLAGWLANLPLFFTEKAPQRPKFRLCHSILQWRYRNFRILMFRPVLVSRLMIRTTEDLQENSLDTETAVQRCLDAARESVDLICAFWIQDQQNMMACWYGLYFLFQAILIPVICLRNDPQSPLAVSWRDQIFKTMSVLESMGRLNPTAFRCLGVIRSLCGTYLDPNTDGWGRPTEESPQTQLANLYPLMWPTLEMTHLDGMESILQESTIMDFMNQLPV